MTPDLSGPRRRWIAAAGGAAVVLVGLLLFLRLVEVSPQKPLQQRTVTLQPIKLDASRAFMTGDLHDQRPLFLPTDRNVGPRSVPRRHPGSSLLHQDAVKLFFAEADLALSLPKPVALPQKAPEVVLDGAHSAPLFGFGREIATIAPLPQRGGTVEVFTAKSNRRVQAFLLAPAVRPPTQKPWRPIEFVATVDAAGLVGSLMVSERSDVEEAELFFANFLARTFRIGERLPPGSYRIVVAP